MRISLLSRVAALAVAWTCLVPPAAPAQTVPEVLHTFAPDFSLPLFDQLKLFTLADLPDKAILVIHLGGSETNAAPAVATLRKLRQDYADQAVQVLTVAVEGGKDLKALKAFVEKHRPDWPVALDDLGEFRQRYIQKNYFLPTFIVITRDRRSLWLSTGNVKENCAALLRTVADEVRRPMVQRPRGPVPYYPSAEAFPAVRIGGPAQTGIRFGKRPAMILVRSGAGDRHAYLKAMAEVHQKHGSKLDVLAAVEANDARAVEKFAQDKPFAVYWSRANPPTCFGPNDKICLALVSAGGRVFKVMELSTSDRYGPILDWYARLLTTPGSLPADLDRQPGVNLAHRAHGGHIDSASSAGAESLLDGLTGRPTWESAAKKAEVVLSFLQRQPVRFDRVVLDNQSTLQDVEILAGDASGAFHTLGVFRLDNRTGMQAFAVPPTQAKFVKVRFLSTWDKRADFALGEIQVEESAEAKPVFAQRLAAAFPKGFRDEFAQGRLTFWQQDDVFAEHDTWTIEQNRLVPPRAHRHTGDYRATALLHSSPAGGDFRFAAVVRPKARACGLVFGFHDWNHFDRVLILRGPLQGDPQGNSIRLERWRHGKAEVLSVHGEWFPLDQEVRLEVIRQQKKLAIKVQGQVIMHVADEEPPPPPGEALGVKGPGRVGLFAADNDGCTFSDVAFTPLTTPLTLPDMPALSTAAGASILFVNGQGSSKEPLKWASNLLRVAALGPQGMWEAPPGEDGQLPEIVFAFKERKEVVLEEVGFALPSAQGPDAKNWTRRVEVLVAQNPNLSASGFQTIGTFDLSAREGWQTFPLREPIACRFLMVRLLKNEGGPRFSLAGIRVGRGKAGKAVSTAAGSKDPRAFAEPADAKEQEPNDTLDRAHPLGAGKNTEALIRPGEVDFFRLPAPPTAKGRPALHIQMKALPWLRLNADVLDAEGKVLAPPLVKAGSGASVQQTRIGTPPHFVRVAMPNSSLSLVIDTSGSMGGREDDVRSAVKVFLQGVTASEEIEVLRFGSAVVRLSPFTRDPKQLAAVSGKINMGGATALYEALLQALENLSSRAGSGAIVLLSDGMNTKPGKDFADLCRHLRRHPVPIYVIGVGMDLYEYDAVSGNTCTDLLQNLALQTGGRFYFAPTSHELADLYRQIADELRGETRYRLKASWQVHSLTPELAVIPTPPVVVGPSPGPLPPGLPELAVDAGKTDGHPVGPFSAGLPPALPELSMPQLPRAPLVLSRLSLPPPFELASSPPLKRPLSAWPGFVPSFPELALDVVAARRLGPSPLSPLPEFGRLRVQYRPAKGGPALPAAVQPAFELVLDCSGSMAELVGKEAKYLIARRVMHELIDAMPDDAHVGLRLFGYMGFWDPKKEPRKPPANDKRYDVDSDCVVSVGRLDYKGRRQLIKEWVDWARPRGKTPLVHSLLEALKDFSADWKGPRTVLLISDGMETCGGKLEDVARAYGQTDIGMVVHVVGFDVQAPEEVKQLQAIARIGRGNFYNAKDARQLADALRQAALHTHFVVHDAQGKTLLASGLVNGPAIELEAGTYRVGILGTRVEPALVRVEDGGVLALSLDEAGKLISAPKEK